MCEYKHWYEKIEPKRWTDELDSETQTHLFDFLQKLIDTNSLNQKWNVENQEISKYTWSR